MNDEQKPIPLSLWLALVVVVVATPLIWWFLS